MQFHLIGGHIGCRNNWTWSLHAYEGLRISVLFSSHSLSFLILLLVNLDAEHAVYLSWSFLHLSELSAFHLHSSSTALRFLERACWCDGGRGLDVNIPLCASTCVPCEWVSALAILPTLHDYNKVEKQKTYVEKECVFTGAKELSVETRPR
jgi:hypothetical protein